MSARFVLSVVVLVAAGVATWVALGANGRQPTVVPPSPPTVTPPPSPAPASLLPAPGPTRTPAHPELMIHYPDGSYMPALNGVKLTPRLQWPADLPFSPIIGKRVAAGTEWYVHADGTQTTTVMAWRSDLGREDALAHVARPMAPAPLDESERTGR